MNCPHVLMPPFFSFLFFLHRVVTLEAGKAFAQQQGMLFAEASAKAGQGVESAFLALVKEIFDKRVTVTEQVKKPEITLGGGEELNKSKKGGCCA